MAGFESGTQLRRDGRRHDFIAATRHDAMAGRDYALLRRYRIASARDGARWHRIKKQPGQYDWSSLDPQLYAAREAGVTVVWDLLHYGWPEWADPLSCDFAARFADFVAALVQRIGPGGHYTPVNEISFLAWAGGEVAYMAPFRTDCAAELKRVLCQLAIAAARAIRALDPAATIYTSEPLIHVARAADDRRGRMRAAVLRQAQHEAALMMIGRIEPDLGGAPDLFDVLGLNYYPHNQFDSRRRLLAADDLRRRPLSAMLCDAQALYGKPLYLSETGAEGDDRAPWLAKVCAEVRLANARGADVSAVCLYPILNHLGWDDDRYCAHGLFCGVDDSRTIYQPLADQIAREQRFDAATATPKLESVS